MAHISSGASSKLQSYHKAHLLEKLVEVKKRVVNKDEKLSQLVQRLQRLEEAHVSQHQEEEEERILTKFDARHHQHQPQSCFDFVKLPILVGPMTLLCI